MVVLPGLKETMIPDLQIWLHPERVTSVLINEKEKTYNLDSKGRQHSVELMEKIKGKHTLPRHERKKRDVCVYNE